MRATKIQNVEVDDAGNLVVCGENVFIPYDEMAKMTEQKAKELRNTYGPTSYVGQLMQCYLDHGMQI